jgi:hypothetical protein
MEQDDYQNRLQDFIKRLQRAIPKGSNLPKEIGYLLNKSPNTIQRKMRGKINIPLDEYLKIAWKFGVTIEPYRSAVSDPDTSEQLACEPVAETSLTVRPTDFGLFFSQVLWLGKQYDARLVLLGGDLPWYWVLRSPRLLSLFTPGSVSEFESENERMAEQFKKTIDRLDLVVLHGQDEIERLCMRLMLELSRGRISHDSCIQELKSLRLGIGELRQKREEGHNPNNASQLRHILIKEQAQNPLCASYLENRLHQLHLHIDGLGLIRTRPFEGVEAFELRIKEMLESGISIQCDPNQEWIAKLERAEREVYWALDKIGGAQI